MGNIQSNDDIYREKRTCLKKMYSMSKRELTNFRNKLNNERNKNLNHPGLLYNIDLQRTLVNELTQEQNRLAGRIPDNEFNKVNEFLYTVNKDINLFVPSGSSSIYSPNSDPQFDFSSQIKTIPIYQPRSKQNPIMEHYQESPLSQNYHRNHFHQPPVQPHHSQHQHQLPSRQNQQQPNPRPQPQSQPQPPTPYEILKIPKKFTLEQLRKAYKKRALETHPDRNNGNGEQFDLVSEAYMTLLEEYKLKRDDKQYHELKEGSNDYMKKQDNYQMKNTKLGGQFDINSFNKLYNEYRIEQPEDAGYADWIDKNQYDTDDISKHPKLSRGFNLNLFNDTFNDEVKEDEETQIVEYKTPQPLVSSGNIHYSELGQKNIKNYTGKSSINYTDYREAHTKTRLIDPNKVKYTTYKNVDEVKHARSNIKDYTSDEWAVIMEENDKKKREEADRNQHLKRTDAKAFHHYDKIHQMMIDNVYRK